MLRQNCLFANKKLVINKLVKIVRFKTLIFETNAYKSRYIYINQQQFFIMKAELIQELQLLQNSRANKFADELADRILSSVDAVNEKLASSLSLRGRMLMLLDKRLNFETLRKLRTRFFKQ